MTTLGHSQPTLSQAQVAQAKERILSVRAEGYSGAYCARQAGIARRTLYHWIAADPEFAAEWGDANESRLDWYEDVLRESAASGMFVPALAVLKNAGRIVDRSPPPGGSMITLYAVFQQILQVAGTPSALAEQPAISPEGALPGQVAPSPALARQVPAIIEVAPSHLVQEPQLPQLEDGTTQAPGKGKPSAKPASRRRPERTPLPR